MRPVVVIEHVSKKYSRSANKHAGYGFADLVGEILGRPRNLSLRKDEFLALDNVSFYINEGESFALVGRNGSGKSTLLKMMNGLIRFDRGTILIDGSVGALINLGAGFNPNLTGKDNIYNAASLTGLNSKEIDNILQSIIEFSELEEFIDSPVGTYSSGMRARLGFSVAISLKPDILLIDEILSVGDHGFRNKCFVKMQQLKKEGVSIVLVSHSPTDVIQLCERALWLHKGKPMKLGGAQETVQAYLDFVDNEEVDKVRDLKDLQTETKEVIQKKDQVQDGDGLYGPIYNEFDRLDNLSVRLLVGGESVDSFAVHDELVIEYSFYLKERVVDLNVTLAFYAKDGVMLSALSTLNGNLLRSIHEGEINCSVRIPDFNLNPGTYLLIMPIHEGKSYLYRNIVKEFVVTGRKRLTWQLVDFRYEYSVNAGSGQRNVQIFQ